jgi:diguanylate cyclase (GGDEF)-like protein/PAS domain S-box-containing protein
VAAFDGRGALVAVNPALTALIGYSHEELASIPLASLVNAAQRKLLRTAFRKARRGTPQTCELSFIHKDGSLLEASVTLLPNLLAHRVVGLHGFVKDISERKHHETRILYLANHDALTGLPNRNLLHDRMQHAIEQARRLNTQVAVLFMDLNRFKIINDSLGHDKGDRLLCVVAERLKAALRDGDTVARLGGDEFVAVLENIRGIEHVQQVATVLTEVLEKPICLDGLDLCISTSIGASIFPKDGAEPKDLLKHADLAMYAAKEAGRVAFRFYEPAMNDRALARLDTENSLRRAIDSGELILHYQPRLDLELHSIAGVEALVRWDHPTKGLIYPSHFVPLAEEAGIIDTLGEWVLRSACRQMQSWFERGMPALRVSINISPLQLQSDRICTVVAQALAESGLDPALLELEITESSLMQNLEASRRTLAELQRMGILLSIDDFGTGYSSLSYLKRLPINTLKIDKSFVRDLSEDEDDASIVNATIAMAHRMHLRVVAEGVVSHEQLRFLKRLKCDEIQGYLLCQPLPSDEAESFLRTCRLRGIECRWSR